MKFLPGRNKGLAKRDSGKVVRRAAFEKKLASVKKVKGLTRRGRIGFIIDRTASREATWEQAQGIQARMFRAVAGIEKLALRLVHFGGGQLTDYGWEDNAKTIAARMAAVRCQSGGTQFLEALTLFADASRENRAGAIILVGDCFEEEMSGAGRLARVLAGKGIKVFSFLEGDDWTAESAFRKLAEITGGRFAHLGADLPLEDLCEGVVLMTAGGSKGVARLKNEKVKRLLLAGPSGR